MGFPVVLSNNSAGSTCLLLVSGFESLSLVSLGGALPEPRPAGWLYSAIHSRPPGHLRLLLRVGGPVMPFKLSFAQGQSWQGVWHSGQRACLWGHHPKAKPNIFQGVWGQQKKAGLLTLEFFSFVKGHNSDFFCYGHPHSEGHCGSQIPSLPKGTRGESRMVCQRGLQRRQAMTDLNTVTSKTAATPMDQIAFPLAPILSLFETRNAKETCSSGPHCEQFVVTHTSFCLQGL